jgi:hypothetical protein
MPNPLMGPNSRSWCRAFGGARPRMKQRSRRQRGRLPVMTWQPAAGPRRVKERRARRRVEQEIAPLRVRMLAVLISAIFAIAFVAALIGVSAGGLRIWRRLRPPQPPRVDDGEEGGLFAVEERPGRSALGASAVSSNRLGDKLQSRKGRLVLALVSLLGAVATEGRQGFVARAVGMRRVDIRTGKEMTRSQALVRVVVRTAWVALARRLTPGSSITPPEEQAQFVAEMQKARRRYGDDEPARQEAFTRIYAKHKPAKPSMWGCWLRLLLSVAIDLPAPWSSLKQSLPDRLAGTAVVLEPHGGVLDRLIARVS